MISREDFKNEVLSTGTIKDRILEFLKKNKDNAYTCKEIASELKINNTSATINLGALQKSGLVDHKGKATSSHWILKEDKLKL